jgi:hypothetical protein
MNRRIGGTIATGSRAARIVRGEGRGPRMMLYFPPQLAHGRSRLPSAFARVAPLEHLPRIQPEHL